MSECFSIAILVILCFTGCSKSADDVAISFTTSEELLMFPLDDSTSNVSADLAYYYDESSGDEMLFSLNTINNEIQIFDFRNSQLIKRLSFEVEGEQGVGNISAFYVHSLDSLFLFPNNGNRLFLTDSESKNIERIDYQVPDGYGNANVASTFFSAKPSLQNGKLVTKALYQGNYSTITNAELSERYVAYAIDLQTGETKSLPHTYPDDYWADVKKHFQFSFTSSKQGTAYSFWGDHNMYFAEDANAKIQVKPARSDALYAEWEALPLGGDRMDRRKYFAASAHYGNIIYDPYREVYYRFCYPKVEIENEEDLGILARFPGAFSLMVLDKSLNVLGEQLFSSDLNFVTSNAFVGKDGLYLSINHPNNPENQEDYLSFRLYQLNR